jgi:surface carbohydrate biosynthesis protein
LTKRLPIVYLPIEVGVREFDSKALLAAVLAKRGYCVLFGEQWTIGTNFARLPPGAVLFKSFNALHHPAMRAARENHHKVFVLEEELLAHTETKAIANYCAAGIFDIPDALLANGALEKAALSQLSGGKLDIEVTGNPRIDLLKPAYRSFFKREIDVILERFGAFVLINTNFGIINSHCTDLDEVTRIHVEAGFVRLDDPASVNAWNDQIEFERLNKAAMITAIKDLSRRRSDLNIVIRPHPAEELERWRGVFDGFPKVSIVRDGPHVPWTLACRLLLHTSCTTGFEAHVAGKAAFSLVVKPNWISRSFISNHLNPLFTDVAKLVDASEAYLARGEIDTLPTLTTAEAEHYVWNIGERNAANRIATLLTKDLPKPRGKIALPPLEAFPRQPTHKAKFTLSMAECADAAGRIFSIIGQPGPITLDQISDSLFYFSPAGL